MLPEPVRDRQVAGQPALGASEADPVFSGQLPEAAALLEVLGDEPEAALLRQTGIGMAMHGCVRHGLAGRTSPRSGLTVTLVS